MKDPREEINLKKYLKPPTPEQTLDFIKELGVNYYQFERYYGIPFNTITQVISGAKPLPVKFWDIVFEKIVPTYGVGYKQNRNLTSNLTRKKPKKKSVIPSTHTQIPQNSIISDQDVSQVQNETEGLNHPLSGLLE